MKVLTETNRLIIREYALDDFEHLYSVCSDPDLMQYCGDGNVLSAELTKKWIEVSINNYKTKGVGNSAIIDKISGEYIGYVGIVASEMLPGEMELIYVLKKKYWGLGIAAEASQSLLDYCFTNTNYQTIYATIATENLNSIKVIEKLGFKFIEKMIEEDGHESLVYKIEKQNY
jgi:[ribosomal protein S5]-alanine N-acetyltransferase